MRPSRARLAGALALLLVTTLGTACGSTAAEPSPATEPTTETVLIASYDFQENQILAEVYAEAARRDGVPVVVDHGIGTREVVAPALQQGVVHAVIDYLGTALAFARPQTEPGERSPGELHAALRLTLGAHGVTVLRAAAAEDQNGFAVARSFAEAHGVQRLSDLAPLAPQLRFGGPPECPERPFCLQGLREVYGLEFGEVEAMPSRVATVEALVSGRIDVGLVETTAARLAVAPIVLLADDRGLQPHENVVPLVRTDVLERYERLEPAFDAVSARLTTQALVELNRAVELDGLTPAEAAARWWDGG
ncbi:osmoprotectant transport system substrate-binding protein [Geodermatophilus africanus]|uniref:Osmoprotectant transport system substrate-binding protein n=1 Tax=Geodermatophilus africanus TaxID=1137993 RepID=A0A1H3NNJ2_9ACTN|nr:ABC transporter substrate-binding protein [Geodermatophilus africanus]SDY90486.1 osmoprotectant transport system substrate-binding protein [Geodermatophilus africanus]